ncbi:MAG TPA: cupin domain-containing protein [Ktedonobacterales bacterium]|nr:cupin domain-containing protein [Ktedonobacterales bacterium]
MPIIRAADAPTYTIPGVLFTGLTAPSRGASELCTWRLEVEPGTAGDAHKLNHEEVFILLDGTLTVTVAGEAIHMAEGDALAVPAETLLKVANPGARSAHAIVCVPAGIRATFADGREFGTPPWAQ